MKKEQTLSLAIAFGVTAGTIIGVLTDNIGLWIAMGCAFGAGIGTVLMKKGQDQE